jgi:ribosome-binding factor A
MNQARARKLSDRVAQIVAELLERRIKDPRLGFVTVTEARVTGDLREATVYYTVYGSDTEVAGTAAALASATGLIRSEVGRQTGIKHTPSISFVRDTVPDTARTIEDLVARARQADAEVAAARADAVPAGDADPYRQPVAADDDDDEFGAGEFDQASAGPHGTDGFSAGSGEVSPGGSAPLGNYPAGRDTGARYSRS